MIHILYMGDYNSVSFYDAIYFDKIKLNKISNGITSQHTFIVKKNNKKLYAVGYN